METTIERFTYPSDIVKQLNLATHRRLRFWVLFLFPFWTFGPYSTLSGDGWLGIWIAVGITCIVLFCESLLRRFARQTRGFADHILVYDGKRLQQISSHGTVIGEIDCTIPFDVSYPWSAAGNAIYRVEQGTSAKRCIEFSSSISNAEHLIRGILKFNEWPPGAE